MLEIGKMYLLDTSEVGFLAVGAATVVSCLCTGKGERRVRVYLLGLSWQVFLVIFYELTGTLASERKDILKGLWVF